MIFLFVDASVVVIKQKKEDDDMEIRAIYISYLEYYDTFMNNPKSINEQYINNMINNIKYYNFNTIFLHVSPFSDAIYNSKIFPYSHTLTGEENKNPGFDYLEYFLKRAHLYKIKVHAWINPYRIRNDNDISKISVNNPAYNLLNTTHVMISKNGIYYNPASEIVHNLIINQVKEIIMNYDVDGIHFDDYFYVLPNIDEVEYQNYLKINPQITLSEYRLNITNSLVKEVYQTIKEYDDSIVYSISPDGNIDNNYRYHYADVNAWGSSEDYVDMLMPQIYYGFNHEYKPFIKTLTEWQTLVKDSGVKLVPVLAYYKTGRIDNGAGFGKYEWTENSDVIKRQVSFLKTSNYAGYCLFRYDFLFSKTYENTISKQEFQNLWQIK